MRKPAVIERGVESGSWRRRRKPEHWDRIAMKAGTRQGDPLSLRLRKAKRGFGEMGAVYIGPVLKMAVNSRECLRFCEISSLASQTVESGIWRDRKEALLVADV
ncbi:hypothetical protein NDU88_002263 [Pleurodeles waltl]|uniref:Uncharacterized protein n=1 Tax=Pleurodeles waltl TaxID=8319 RepID=A0AAV7M121_PLEWA|nr:hypothetical protein NDU88_002263 [Pleurodeles waltl]